MSRLYRIGIFALTGCAALGAFMTVHAQAGIINTKHNLSVSGPGEIKAAPGGETRICIFCHTPHNAAPQTPLWNKKLDPITYTPYSSTTMVAKPSQPTGPTRLCLSCHDGTLALGAVLWPLDPVTGLPSQFAMTQEKITSVRPSYLGMSLADDHPVSFSYFSSLPNSQLSSTLPSGLVFYGTDTVHCSTCHDAHNNANKKFLRVDNTSSGLCTLCHNNVNGWITTIHRTSTKLWNGLAPNPWPRTGQNTDFNWTTVAQNGCENCHMPHTAGGAKRLLNYLNEESNCYPCHNGNVDSKNIQAQFQKISRHPVELTTIGVTAKYHLDGELPAMISGHVECVDCHNAHAANNIKTALPPKVSGPLEMVSGVSILGAGITPPNFASFEYEICFKCHSESGSSSPVVSRVINTVNTRMEFSLTNPSYHPVAGIGKNLDVPSIPSASMPGLTPSSLIYCTDCHDSDQSVSIGGTGPRGPHGSIYRPIIRQQYVTTDNTLESPSNYALCYWCHDRTSILSNVSFKQNSLGVTPSKGGHSGHLGLRVNAPCSACHDAHGIPDDGMSGSHARLMNFDIQIAFPVAGNIVPFFTGAGARTGSCTLVCHSVTHTPACTDTTGVSCINSSY